jgi:HEPN domain-containing protein
MPAHKDWLFKAETDLKSAQKLLSENLLDTAIYHTQQCAEKALKAFLAFQKQEIQKAHDLEFLTKLCEQIDGSFACLLNIASNLKPYGIKFRYPDDVLIPAKKDVEIAIRQAEKIYLFVIKKTN